MSSVFLGSTAHSHLQLLQSALGVIAFDDRIGTCLEVDELVDGVLGDAVLVLDLCGGVVETHAWSAGAVDVVHLDEACTVPRKKVHVEAHG